jgi:hypothetical protein
MSLNDTIQELFKLGCHKITFGLNEKQEPALCVEQFLNTESGISESRHQFIGESPVDLVNKALVVARHSHEMKSTLVKLPNGR